jgi:hypothetical protein
MDMTDQALVMVMTKGIGANLSNDEKRAHLIDLKREHLIDQVCIQEMRNNVTIREALTIVKKTSVRYYKTLNRVICATTGKIASH